MTSQTALFRTTNISAAAVRSAEIGSPAGAGTRSLHDYLWRLRRVDLVTKQRIAFVAGCYRSRLVRGMFGAGFPPALLPALRALAGDRASGMIGEDDCLFALLVEANRPGSLENDESLDELVEFAGQRLMDEFNRACQAASEVSRAEHDAAEQSIRRLSA